MFGLQSPFQKFARLLLLIFILISVLFYIFPANTQFFITVFLMVILFVKKKAIGEAFLKLVKNQVEFKCKDFCISYDEFLKLVKNYAHVNEVWEYSDKKCYVIYAGTSGQIAGAENEKDTKTSWKPYSYTNIKIETMSYSEWKEWISEIKIIISTFQGKNLFKQIINELGLDSLEKTSEFEKTLSQGGENVYSCTFTPKYHPSILYMPYKMFIDKWIV